MNNKVYIVGHKSPDLDSVVAAISYANFKNKKENTDKYVPATAGNINKVTEFVLKKFNFDVPEQLNSAKDKEIILVDHNEVPQMVEGGSEARYMEIIDHHKLSFSYGEPITVLIKPWGSSNSIIYKEYLSANIEIDRDLAGLMLSAVLDDTVITKSPTCTEIDKKIIKELSEIAEVKDWQSYGMEMFKVKASIEGMSEEEIINLDYKDYEFKTGKFGIGQLETVDLSEFDAKEEALLKKLEDIKENKSYHSVVLVVTDIINEGSRVLVSTNDQEGVEKALEGSLVNNKLYKQGLISRKKQVVPAFSNIFD